MIKYCPTCPRSSEDVAFIGEFCEVCTSERIRSGMPTSFKIPRCKMCGKIKAIDEFVDFTYKNIEMHIQREIHNRNCKIAIKSLDSKGNAVVAFDYPVGNRGESVSFEIGVRFRFPLQTCIKCSRRNSGYYQAIVQLRGSEEMTGRMADKISRFLERRDSFVSKSERVKNGIDLYVEDKLVMNSFFDIYKNIRPKRSYTLAGMRNGKKLYRNTYLIDLSDGMSG